MSTAKSSGSQPDRAAKTRSSYDVLAEEYAKATLGFGVVEQLQRDPYPEVEYQSVRGYIWAAKTANQTPEG